MKMDEYISVTTKTRKIFGVSPFPYIIFANVTFPNLLWLDKFHQDVLLKYLSPEKLWFPDSHEIYYLATFLNFRVSPTIFKHIFPMCKTITKIRMSTLPSQRHGEPFQTKHPRKRIIISYISRNEHPHEYSFLTNSSDEYLELFGFKKIWGEMVLQ